MDTTNILQWWGNVNFDLDQVMSWGIADRQILLQRQVSEWSCWNIETKNEPLDAKLNKDDWTDPLPDNESLSRYLQGQTSNSILIQPALADRPVVARPNVPLKLLSKESVTLFISTPLWFQARIAEGQEPIVDIPFWRPSDSWFGPNTIEGEFCYAKYTEARVNVDQIKQRNIRAITPIHIQNQHKEPMFVDRVKVPVTALHLYVDAKGQMWTNSILIERENSGEVTVKGLVDHPPAQALSPVLVNSPRKEIEKHNLMSSLSNLFN